jgi:hypothetical protein
VTRRPVSSRVRAHCHECGAPLRPFRPVCWVRFGDGVLHGPFCDFHYPKGINATYDEDGVLVAYLIHTFLDDELPEHLPIGADPLEW